MTQRRMHVALFGAALAMVLCAGVAAAQVGFRSIVINLDGALGDTTGVGMADSSQWMPTRKYQRMYLDLKPSRPCRVAIAVYEAAASDTATATTGFQSVGAALDTLNVVVWPWRGATNVTVGTDSLSVRELSAPTSVAAASYEMVYEFPADAAAKWGAPRGRKIALHSPISGEWFSGDWTRIRLRVLSASGVVTWVGRLKGYGW